MRIFLIIYVFVIAAVISTLGFRGATSTKPPLEVFPDMDRQARYKPQAENQFFADGRNDRPVPLNTVARGNYFNQVEVFSEVFSDTELGNSTYKYGKTPEGEFVERLPIAPTNELMQLGHEKYDIFCTVCHGAAGDGNGVVKQYGVLAASYHDERLRDAGDGYLYDVISNGKGLMYGLKDRMSPEERWAVVLYMRALQTSQNAKASDLSEAQRMELGF